METSKNNKKFNIYISISILVLIFLASYFFSNYFSKSNDSLYIITKEVDTINTNLLNEINNDFNDIDSLKEAFNESISSLTSVSEIVDNNYSENAEYKNLILTSLSSNIDFYNNCIEALNNNNEIASSSELIKFSSLKDSCIQNYKNLLSYFKFDFKFADNMDKIFNNYYLSLNNLIKENRSNEFKEKQKREFIIKLEKLNESIPSMNEDLMPAIIRIREEERDLSIILEDIKKKEESFLNLKNSIVSISVPDGLIDYYTLFSEYLNLYEIYLESMKTSVTLEYSLNDYNENSKTIDKYYKNSASKREDILDSYTSYINNLNN